MYHSQKSSVHWLHFRQPVTFPEQRRGGNHPFSTTLPGVWACSHTPCSCQASLCTTMPATAQGSSTLCRSPWAAQLAKPKVSSSTGKSHCGESWKRSLAPVFPREQLLSCTAAPVCLWPWPLTPALILTRACHVAWLLASEATAPACHRLALGSTLPVPCRAASLAAPWQQGCTVGVIAPDLY